MRRAWRGIHPFLQQNVLNYRDFMLAKFKKDLADSDDVAVAPTWCDGTGRCSAVHEGRPNATMVAEVEEFINELRDLMDGRRLRWRYGGGRDGLRHQHAVGEEDVERGPGGGGVPTADGQVAVRKTDPN